MSSQEQRLVDEYIKAVGTQRGDYILSAEELAWALRYTYQWNTLRLRLLTALQQALPLSKGQGQPATAGKTEPVQALKETLTNVIIMQTRLQEREEPLVPMLEAALKSALVPPVLMDPQDVRKGVEHILAAYRHLKDRAGGT